MLIPFYSNRLKHFSSFVSNLIISHSIVQPFVCSVYFNLTNSWSQCTCIHGYLYTHNGLHTHTHKTTNNRTVHRFHSYILDRYHHINSHFIPCNVNMIILQLYCNHCKLVFNSFTLNLNSKCEKNFNFPR